jgi:hypothetical protein
MEEEVVYRPTYDMSQETNNSETVSTAQTTENHDQTEVKTTITGDQQTLTFGGEDGTENSTNAQASFGDYEREISQETNPPHCQIQALPVPGEQPKTLTPPKSDQESNPQNTKQTKNSRKTRMSHKADKDFIVKKARNQSREIVENNKKSTDQSNGTENDKNDFQLGESLTSSSEATGNPKETWGDENYKPPWGWDPIPFPEDPSWAENNEINERLAREQAISGGSSPPPKLSENNLFSGALITGLRTVANHSDKGLQQNKDPHNHTPIVTVMWKPKPRRNTGCPFALGLIVDGTIRTKQGRLISVRDQPPSPPCFNTPDHPGN